MKTYEEFMAENGIPQSSMTLVAENATPRERLAVAEFDRDAFWKKLYAMEHERDVANKVIAEQNTLVSRYQERIVQSDRERDCAVESREGQLRNTIAATQERDEARATIAAQSSVLATAREALKVGRAWSEEYLVECEELPVEAERVRGGLVKIDKAIAAIDAALTGRTG